MLRIRELPHLVTAAKADWLAATDWVGFTPPDASLNARERRRSAINAQIRNGYVIEYITLTIDFPNEGHGSDPGYLRDRERHSPNAGRLVAVHRLVPSVRPLSDILGADEYEHLQDMWAKTGRRHRWSIVFPIMESYSIRGRPLANEVFDTRAMKRLFAHPSGTLRPLDDDERLQIADLELERRPLSDPWLFIDADANAASRSEIAKSIQNSIERDLAAALEGQTEDRKTKLKRRAAWLAQRFVLRRERDGNLKCDDCMFDPTTKAANSGVRPRSLIDVHHKSPLQEGVRLTTELDFSLLCPNCHRFAHAIQRQQTKAVGAR